MNDLLKKLQDLGLKIDRSSNIEPASDRRSNVDDFIKGVWVESNSQRIFVVKRLYPSGKQHGTIELKSGLNRDGVDEFWPIDGLGDPHLNDLVFLDTETSSLNIGAGALIFLFGCCYFVNKGLEVLQIFIEDPSHESLFLAYIGELLDRFKCLVSYNGKSFDIPVMRSRYILNRIPHSLNHFSHIDLLHIARRIWKYDLDSKRLSDIEAKVLGFTRDEEEVPGWLVPQIYQDYVQIGIAEPLKGVFYHNEIDVVSLAALFLKINQMLVADGLQGNENLSLGEIFHKAKKFDVADEYFKHALENNPNAQFKEKILLNLAFSLKKQEKFVEMCAVWKMMADEKSVTACVELAKYCEHKLRDYHSALDWTEKAIVFVDTGLENLHEIMAELEHRKLRLLEKRDKE